MRLAAIGLLVAAVALYVLPAVGSACRGLALWWRIHDDPPASEALSK